MSDAGRITRIVARELGLIPSPYRRRALERILCGPYRAEREGLACWIVARSALPGVDLIYSEHAPDPEARWAFAYEAAPGPPPTEWSWYLEEAFIRSGAWDAPTILFDQARFHVPPSERFGARRDDPAPDPPDGRP